MEVVGKALIALGPAEIGQDLAVGPALAAAVIGPAVIVAPVSARALFGLLGSDDVTLKVSPNGSAFFDAFVIDRATGRAEFPAPIVIPGLSAVPASPPAGKLPLYGRQRAGAPWLEVVRPSGRDFPLQPHMGLNRIGAWAPVSATTIAAQGIALTSVGTVIHPALAAGSLLSSSRGWRVTSAAVVDSVCDQRLAVTACWRGNAVGLGGFNRDRSNREQAFSPPNPGVRIGRR